MLQKSTPLQQAFKLKRQQMDTHINGLCPTHIYEKRRPIESKNPYALDYRKSNFQPITKQEFNKAIQGCINVISKSSITVDKDDRLPSLYIEDLPLLDYVKGDIVRDRELDPNSVFVIMPDVELMTDGVVSVKGWEVELIGSGDILEQSEYTIKIAYKDYDYMLFTKEGIFVAYTEKNKQIEVSLIEYSIDVKPYVHISNLITKICIEEKKKEHHIEIRDSYFSGAAAWGDKFLSQETDLMIISVNNTYIKEIRYKKKCDALGTYYNESGVHCSSKDHKTCGTCSGTGFISGDSPLNVIEVSYEENSEGLPEVVKWSEPPQNAIKTSIEMCDSYFEKMCNSLGLVNQNMTNQSGTSKAFDYKQKLDTINEILTDSVRVLKELYGLLKAIIDESDVYNLAVRYISNIDSQIYSSTERLAKAKAEGMPPFMQEGIIDAIYIDALGDSDIVKAVLKWAKIYDKLYIYNNTEIATARAMYGTLTERDINIHNSIIRVLLEYFNVNEVDKNPTEYLNTVYPTTVNLPILA